MRYITFTNVDVQTGIPVTIEPARNGPTLPAGCGFGFALESQYPTAAPTFYGQTDGPLDTPGILSVITKAQYDAAEAAEMEAREANKKPTVPDVVTMRQAKITLSRAGVLAGANAAIAAMTGQPGEEARIEWEYATSLRRDHSLVKGIGVSLGLTEPEIDDLFVQAAQVA